MTKETNNLKLKEHLTLEEAVRLEKLGDLKFVGARGQNYLAIHQEHYFLMVPKRDELIYTNIGRVNGKKNI